MAGDPRWRREYGVTCLQTDWNPAHSPEELGAGEIHFLVVDFDKSVHQADMEMLTEREHIRASQYLDSDKRQLYLGGRIGLRKLICHYTGLANESLKFHYGSRGKPVLANGCDQGDLKFNYTLSRHWGLYAFSWNIELGVDLEVFPRSMNFEALYKRKMTVSEQNEFDRLPDDFKNEAALHCWTRKEAYGKLLGVGIRYFLGAVGLFEDLSSPYWQTRPQGLFAQKQSDFGDNTGAKNLLGVQITLPFPGAASVMYSSDSLNPDAISFKSFIYQS